MSEFLMMHYLWLQALHIISFVAWMAGLLYLPRLFAYHVQAAPSGIAPESDAPAYFEVMEKRLLRYIMNPAMFAVFIFGILMLVANPALMSSGWLHAKWLLVAGLAACHMAFAKWRKNFAAGKNTHSAKFYKIWNEVPTVLMIGIVLLAVIKPF